MHIGFLIKQLNSVFARDCNQAFQKHNLTIAQIDVLGYLNAMKRRGEAVNQRAIEETLHLKNPTVTGTLNRLEAKGFIRRVTDPRDGRSKLIELTCAEDGLREQAERMRTRKEAQITRGFAEEEIRTFEDLLTRALKNLTEEWEDHD